MSTMPLEKKNERELGAIVKLFTSKDDSVRAATVNNLMLQVICIFFDWILIKQIIVSLLLGETDFRKNAAWGNE